MELRHLRYFKAVAEARGFHQAAKRLNISQAAISQTVVNLEEEMQVKLLERNRRCLELTPAGKVFLKEVNNILRQVELAAEAARQAARGEVGSLAIGYIGSATSHFLPELVRKYRQQYPEVSVSLHEMSPMEQEEGMLAGRLDIAFVYPTLLDATQCGVEVLWEDSLRLLVPAEGHWATQAEMISLAAVAAEKFVFYDRATCPVLFDVIMRSCAAAEFVPRVLRTVGQMQTVLTLVEAGEGISIVPESVWNLRRNDRVRILSIDDLKDSLPFCVLWCSKAKGPYIQNFLKKLREQLASEKEPVVPMVPSPIRQKSGK
jgi:DNA-binding transcriptional LysR family regulator